MADPAIVTGTEPAAPPAPVSDPTPPAKDPVPPADPAPGPAEGSKEPSLLGDALDVLNGKTPPPPAAEPKEGEGEGHESEGAEIPEHYEFKLPEGMQLDQEGYSALEPILKEAKVAQEAAQKVIDLYIQRAEASRNADRAAYSEVVKSWTEQTKADPEIGGAKLAENLGLGAKVLNKFGTPAALDILKDSGLMNHPEVIRMFVKIGRVISEDKFIEPAPGASKVSNPAEETAQILFPNSLK